MSIRGRLDALWKRVADWDEDPKCPTCRGPDSSAPSLILGAGDEVPTCPTCESLVGHDGKVVGQVLVLDRADAEAFNAAEAGDVKA